MNRHTPLNPSDRSFERIDAGNSTRRTPPQPTAFVVADASKARLGMLGLSEARISSLKVLVTTLLSQIEKLEKQLASDGPSELSLQREVHQFEAALIKSALAKTGGRQRRAARLLGVKVTTLNTKIKRHKIMSTPDTSDAATDNAGPQNRTDQSE
jgi:DNA-binding protein Fis